MPMNFSRPSRQRWTRCCTPHAFTCTDCRLLLCPSRHPPQSVAACLFIVAQRILARMGTKSRETIYGGSVRAAAERATEARKEADRLAVEAWNKRMLGFQGPAQPSPTLGDAITACSAIGRLPSVRRTRSWPRHRAGSQTTRVHELERHRRCRLLSASRATIQAQPSGRIARHHDHCERSAVDVVARGAVMTNRYANCD